MAEKRVFYRDIIPYDTPSSLDALRGPETGLLTLPVTVHWGPERTVDLSTEHGLTKAYRNLVREGSSEQQEAMLNATLLKRVWPDLILPARCRQAWESRFPELAA